MKENKAKIKELKCHHCGKEKTVSEMKKNSCRPNGYENICRSCRSNMRRKNGGYYKEREYSYAKRAGQKVPLVTAEHIAELSIQDCVYCGVSLTDEDVLATCDHVYPIGKDPSIKRYGGVNIPQNLLPACKKCNGVKRDLFAIEAFDRYPERFKPELLRPFINRFIGGLIGRELTDVEVEQMIQHLRDEAVEVRRNTEVSVN